MLSINISKSYLTTTTTTILCGASGAALGSLMFPVGTILGGSAGAAIGFYLSMRYVLPYLNDLTIEKFNNEFSKENNLPVENQYENVLNLNINSSNKLIKNARKNY